MDSSISFFEVLPMKLPNDPEVLPQRRLERGGKHGCPILAPLPIPDGDLVLAEVDVFDPQAQAFHQAHPGPVEKGQEEMIDPGQPRKGASHFVPRQHDRQMPSPFGPDQPFELAHLAPQDGPVEKEQGAQGLGLGRRADPLVHRQMGQEGIHLNFAHLRRMALPMEQDVVTYPMKVGLLRPQAHVPHPQCVTDLVEQARRLGCRRFGHVILPAAEDGGGSGTATPIPGPIRVPRCKLLNLHGLSLRRPVRFEAFVSCSVS